MGIVDNIMDKFGIKRGKSVKKIAKQEEKNTVEEKPVTKKIIKKAKKSVIPEHIQNQIILRVDKFNNKKMLRRPEKYYARMEGKFIYLMFAMGGGRLDPICRLKYNGDLEDMDFAIYKYSSEKYDPNECFFPGEEFVDGTLEGAMKAGIKAYL